MERVKRRQEPAERDRGDADLGYGQGAPHPGGEQDLENKTETEEEHG